jgi:putative flippase GtrA
VTRSIYRVIMFAFVGGFGIVVNMFFFSLGLKIVSAEVASFYAFLIAATINYLLNSHFTFAATPEAKSLIVYFIIASVFALLGGFFTWLLSFIGINLYLAQLGVISLLFPFSYICHRRFSFPSR